MENRRILVIEPDEGVSQQIKEILELADFEVIIAAEGETGREIALSGEVGLVLCSAQLPDMDSFDILASFQDVPANRFVPFLFLIEKGYKSQFRKGMNLGADDIISKPCDAVELIDIVGFRLEKRERLIRKNEKTCNPTLDIKLGESKLLALFEEDDVLGFKTREYIFREGQVPRHLYKIKSGQVKVFRTNNFGKDFVVNVYGVGDVFGYHPLLNDGGYQENLVAVEDVEMVVISKSKFLDLMRKDQNVFHFIIRKLAEDLHLYEQKMLSIAYDSVRKRIANTLLNLHDRIYVQQSGIILLRGDLSNMVGTAKESVSRTLSEFKSEKLINLESGTITILHKDKLANLLN